MTWKRGVIIFGPGLSYPDSHEPPLFSRLFNNTLESNIFIMKFSVWTLQKKENLGIEAKIYGTLM
jgi:hypothetical protein